MTRKIKASNIATGAVTAAVLDNSGVTAGSYGSSTAIPVLTINAKGQVTVASTASLPSNLATETYVNTAVSNLVDAAPTALNTLNELAAALGDDANYAATITTALGTKANTSSLGTLATVSPTGTASSSTFLRGDNSWQVVAVTPTAVSDQANSSTGYFALPVGTTAQRPASPARGMFRMNSTTSAPEWYDSGSATWVQFNQGVPYTVEVLIVAGGGGGGIHSGGGGGAGGLLYYGSESPKTPNGSAISVTGSSTYPVVVGSGGASSGGAYQSVAGYGYNGTDSTVFGLTALGGGGGGAGGNSQPGKNGGSGGGGGRTFAGGSGTSGQGNSGGYWGQGGANYPGGGGGGASAAGQGGNSGQGGNGGNGYAYSISGTSTYYAGGGGGNLQYGGTQGTGGLGGGANGNPGDGIDATSNTGGGGGGAEYNSGKGGGYGGSGIVIIRYAGSQRGTGGTITSSGGYTIHKFTSSGTFTA